MRPRLKVYVQGAFANRDHRQMFRRFGWQDVEEFDEADVICWTGGADIGPGLYGEKALPCTYVNPERDIEDVLVFDAVQYQKILVGTCRGGQLLNVLNGGRLWQDVDGHENGNHTVIDMITEEHHLVNTLHHQGIIPSPAAEIIAINNVSAHKISDGKQWHAWVSEGGNGSQDLDVEACWYPLTQSLCVQWHPEFPHKPSEKYFFELLDRYITAA